MIALDLAIEVPTQHVGAPRSASRRLTLDDVRSTLAARGFRVVAAERYGMHYCHKPGRAVRLLSHQPLLGLAQVSFRLANALAGPLGNKLTVQAAREPE